MPAFLIMSRLNYSRQHRYLGLSLAPQHPWPRGSFRSAFFERPTDAKVELAGPPTCRFNDAVRGLASLPFERRAPGSKCKPSYVSGTRKHMWTSSGSQSHKLDNIEMAEMPARSSCAAPRPMI